MNTRIARLALALAVAASVPALAQDNPNVARGFSPEKAFQIGDIDHVNLFNGHLLLTVPIGQTYPLGGGLSYGLKLTYNNKIWDISDYDWTLSDGSKVIVVDSIPSLIFNAGLGWRLSLGEINPPLVEPDDEPVRTTYMDPDGGIHHFYPSLHVGESEDPKVKYTRDGSYLRYVESSDGATATVEFPDGAKHTFFLVDGETPGTKGLPSKLADRFGNSVDVTYTSIEFDLTPNNSGDSNYEPRIDSWTLTDSAGRTQTVTFDTSGLEQHTVPRVASVALAAFDGNTASYNFCYNGDCEIPYSSTPMRGCGATDNSSYVQQPVWLLTAIQGPEGLLYSMPQDAGTTSYGTTDDGSAPCDTGMLKRLALPTGGTLAWKYRKWSFPADSSGKNGRTRSTGVDTRTVTDDSGAREWKYTNSEHIDSTDSGCHDRVTTVTAPSPLNFKTEHYFSTSGATCADTAADAPYEYGLPLSRLNPLAGTSLFLSRKEYNGSGALLRSTYVSYEHDELRTDGVEDFPEERTRYNQRVFSTRTVFEDDAGAYAQTISSDFDGLGHYRVATESGFTVTEPTRKTETKFNSGRGTYDSDPTSNSFSPLATSAPWVLNTFDSQEVTEDGAKLFTEFCFDGATGFLKRKRTRREAGLQHGNDLVAVLTVEPASGGAPGSVKREQNYGGDAQNSISSGSAAAPVGICTLALPLTDAYRIDHTYSYGSLATSTYANAAGLPLSFKSADQDIDKNTGLAKTSRDSAGLITTYTYDKLGRTKTVTPPVDAAASYVYTAATTSSLATVDITQEDTQSTIVFDKLGRVFRKKRLLPDGTWNVRQTTYDAIGNKQKVSEVEAYSASYTPTNATTLEYDAFRRPTKVTAPDGTYTQITYTGTEKIERATSNALSRGTTEGHDRYGRLRWVKEWSGGLGSVTTFYGYDVGNHLTSAGTNGHDGRTPAEAHQDRTFAYDGRGFLTSETHPEKGPNGNGTVTYAGFDARGHIGSKTDGDTVLKYAYDRAERLTGVTDAGNNALKAFSYDSCSGGLGRLCESSRYNHSHIGYYSNLPSTVRIAQGFTYGADGRVSQRVTSWYSDLDSTPSFQFVTGWTYDSLGNPVRISYPRCTLSIFNCGSSDEALLSKTYAKGLLTGVPGYATLIYGPDMRVTEVHHSNGIIDVETPDAHGMPRPGRLYSAYLSTGATPRRWDSGNYAFDAAGNIYSIGADSYEYDYVNRLTSATVGRGDGSYVTKSFGYDSFGNLAIDDSVTDAATNRLLGTNGVPQGYTCENAIALPVQYDAAGNLTCWQNYTYDYDRFNQMIHYRSPVPNPPFSDHLEWDYLYDADDERVAEYKVSDPYFLLRFTLRDLDAKVLNSLDLTGAGVLHQTYSIYRGSQLLAEQSGNEDGYATAHLSLDHLGTPRLATNQAGDRLAYHVYLPYGQEITAVDQDDQRLKFTGHQRDVGDANTEEWDNNGLDYMHARHYSPLVGRFLSTDPASPSHAMRHPQKWNRYSYALGNPLRYVDPNGLEERTGWEAGIVVNDTPNTIIWIAGDVDGQTVVIPLLPGEFSTDFFGDTDAIVIDEDQNIDGETEGVFKLGASEEHVTGTDELALARSPGYYFSYLIGRAGYSSSDKSPNPAWQTPKGPARYEAAKQRELLRQRQIREKAKAEKKKAKEEAKKKRRPKK